MAGQQAESTSADVALEQQLGREKLMRGRTFSHEYKLAIVRRSPPGAKRPAQASRDYELAESLLLRWCRECEEWGEGPFTPEQPSREAALSGAYRRARAPMRAVDSWIVGDRERLAAGADGTVGERHELIDAALIEHAALSVAGIYRLLGVGRSWDYIRLEPTGTAGRDIAIRDTIERLPEVPS